MYCKRCGSTDIIVEEPDYSDDELSQSGFSVRLNDRVGTAEHTLVNIGTFGLANILKKRFGKGSTDGQTTLICNKCGNKWTV